MQNGRGYLMLKHWEKQKQKKKNNNDKTRTHSTLNLIRFWPRFESFPLLIHSFIHSFIYSFIQQISIECPLCASHWIRSRFRHRKSQFLWSLLLEGSSLAGKMDFIQYFTSWLYNYGLMQWLWSKETGPLRTDDKRTWLGGLYRGRASEMRASRARS